jgi:putative transposase
VLTALVEHHGRPATIQCDQGTEFTSIAMDAWAYWQHIPLDFRRRGTPGDAGGQCGQRSGQRVTPT